MCQGPPVHHPFNTHHNPTREEELVLTPFSDEQTEAPKSTYLAQRWNLNPGLKIHAFKSHSSQGCWLGPTYCSAGCKSYFPSEMPSINQAAHNQEAFLLTTRNPVDPPRTTMWNWEESRRRDRELAPRKGKKVAKDAQRNETNGEACRSCVRAGHPGCTVGAE